MDWCEIVRLKEAPPELRPRVGLALEQDRTDTLGAFRERFYIRPGVIYLDGNSLGAPFRKNWWRPVQPMLISMRSWLPFITLRQAVQKSWQTS